MVDGQIEKDSSSANLLCRHYTLLSWLSYILGIGLLLFLPHPWYNNKTYFSGDTHYLDSFVKKMKVGQRLKILPHIKLKNPQKMHFFLVL